MGQILVRHLDDEVKAALQRRAHAHGWSTEEEVREILRTAVLRETDDAVKRGTAIANEFRGLGLNFEITELRGNPVGASDLDEL